MHILGGLIILTQILFAYHAIKNRKDTWVYIILFFPMIGCALYLFMEVLPEAGRHRSIRQLGAEIVRAVDPTRNLRRLREKAELSGSVRNKHDLAEEMIRCGLYEEALEILKELPFGVFENDPNILLDIARAYFFMDDYSSALATLEQLKTTNPSYKSQEAHLIYARSLENLGRWEEALNEYESLIRYFSGEEARCRMALLMQKMGHTEKSNRLFKEIVEKARRNSSYFNKTEKEWIRIAERHAPEK